MTTFTNETNESILYFSMFHYLKFLTHCKNSKTKLRGFEVTVTNTKVLTLETRERTDRTKEVHGQEDSQEYSLDLSHGLFFLVLVLSEAGQEADDALPDLGLRGEQGRRRHAVAVQLLQDQHLQLGARLQRLPGGRQR